MYKFSEHFKAQQNLTTLSVGAVGGLIGYYCSLPLYPIIGPAVLVSLLSFSGISFKIDTLTRDVAFVFLGLNIGSGIDPSSLSSILKWPLAFLLLFLSLIMIIIVGTRLLNSVFGFAGKSAILSSSPGHLSYVLGLAVAHESDVARISILQTIRLMLLTLSVPFLAKGFGYPIAENVLPSGVTLDYVSLFMLIATSGIIGFVLNKLRVPAAYLLSGMAISSVGHVTSWTPGTLPNWLIIGSFIVLGSLIGSRFSGLSLKDIREVSVAGAMLTTVTILISVLFAIPAALWVDIPVTQALFAFAPGGLETMIIMGAIVGADPAFLAACHVSRLFFLSVFVPIALARVKA